jgi:integrase/recombinase XerD
MLSCFIEEFTTYCNNLHYAKNTIKELLRYLQALDNSLKEQSINNITKVKYLHLINFVTLPPSTPNTVKGRIWALKKFYGFLTVKDYIEDNISKSLNPPKIPKKETLFLTKDELKIVFRYLVNNINQTNGLRDFVIISLMSTLALRKSSVVSLNVEYLDVINQRIFIEEKGIKSKRPMVLPSVIFDLLQKYIITKQQTGGALFISRNKKRLRVDAVDKIVSRIKESLLNEGHWFAQNLHPHIFRHSAATELNDIAGFDITREILGHRNVQNTRKYIHLSPTAYGTYMKKHPYFLKQRILV